MVSKIAGIVLFAIFVGSECRRQNMMSAAKQESEEASQMADPMVSLQNAFRKEGYSDDEIKKIQARLFDDKIAEKHWPFTDHSKEIANSINNKANTNAGAISEAVTRAGGDPSDPSSIKGAVPSEAARILASKDGDSQSHSLLQEKMGMGPCPSKAARPAMQPAVVAAVTPVSAVTACGMTVPTEIGALGVQAQENYAAIQALTGTMSCNAGSIACNTAQLARLEATAGATCAAISAVTEATATLQAVTGPTIALANTLGVSAGTVSNLALAGSFLGPLLGVIALVYAAWPEEQKDPWLQVEEKVKSLISERFDQHRRNRLSDRLKRYIKQFSRCSQGWISHNMVNLHDANVPRWLVAEAKRAKQGGGSFDMTNLNPPEDHYFTVPACMSQLEGHMSLERDEWYGTDKGTMSALFMPFANMHTQILSLLADDKFDKQIGMQWEPTLKITSAEYGAYMLKHVKSAWKAQVCRSMRLKSYQTGLSWEYSYVVLQEVQQPNAGEDCSSKCNGESGWCNFCGGRNEGACCKKGDQGVCANFDAPSTYQTCVHVGCTQDNTEYVGTKVDAFTEMLRPEECRQVCQSIKGAKFFTTGGEHGHCACLAADAQRRIKKGASSGPTECTFALSLKAQEEKLANKTKEVAKVPMEEKNPCKRSPAVGNYAELEKSHSEWVQQCYDDAAYLMIKKFNTFYEKFARFLDTLLWKAGCGAPHDVAWAKTVKGDGMLKVSEESNFGLFGDCDWQKEKQEDSNVWIFDETKKDGWFQGMQLEEQKAATMKYPSPAWLSDLLKGEECMTNTAAGTLGVADPEEEQTVAVGAILTPVSEASGEYEEIYDSWSS